MVVDGELTAKFVSLGVLCYLLGMVTVIVIRVAIADKDDDDGSGFRR